MALPTQRKRIFLLHLSFWCLYFSFFLYQITSVRPGHVVDLQRAFWDALTHVLFMALIAYVNYFYFLPRFLAHKKAGRYLLEFIGPLVLLIGLNIAVKRLIYGGTSLPAASFLYTSRFVVQHVISTLFIVAFISTLKLAEGWFELEANKKEIENERLNAELRFLKAQINPHFLFNTLNNLYYLAFTQSPNTTEVIAKLSQMMRYMIHDSNHPKVPLSKEIEYMQNYISLEQLRLNNQIPIGFEVLGNPSQVLIVPFIFITFLENAFKHGVSNNFAEAWVNVRIEIEGTQCTYRVENSKLPAADALGEKSGIGLQNLERRLQLSYPHQHELRIEDTPELYSVQLTLSLE
ncbi:histidine kinase [Rhabdobacter roseus]|uniref:Sensor histidine kinase YesM n=1 Tax=Rhabdobacter roseus TaxID=1655419 RepID=A0A840TXP1_9BACT|nr:histidine kinase [Rhabdobacter roseus]MBB5286347.1 sensor histidine kinase YesM [Rhabdobacter roseus]